jgi:iron complex outermembrane receptor protein
MAGRGKEGGVDDQGEPMEEAIMNHNYSHLARFAARMLTGTAMTGLALWTTAAFAQATEPTAPQTAEAQGEVAAPAGATGSEIVVTGSRIVRDGYTAPTPVTVVSPQQLAAAAPANIPQGLQQLPQFSGGRSTSTVSGVGNVPSGGNYLSLRNLGPRRTLTLFDGVRLPPTDAEGNVDANVIPQALIARVDVVTGGASAAYGSDAVSGVVNFVLDTKFNGLKGGAQVGTSKYKDADSYRFNLAGGFDVPNVDGLHALFSYDHYEIQGLRDSLANRQAGRPYGDLGIVRLGTGTATNPYFDVQNGRYPDGTYGSVVINRNLPNGQPHPLNNMQFGDGGVLLPFDRGRQVGSFSEGGQGGESFGKSLTGHQNNEQAFGRLDYEASDTLSAFVQGTYADSYATHTTIASGTQTGAAHRVFSDNAFLPQAAVNLLNSIADPAQRFINVGRIQADQPPKDARFRTKAWTAMAGLRGKVGTFEWRLNYMHGDSYIRAAHSGNFDQRNYYAAIDAVRSPTTGNIVCRVTITNPGLQDDCVPFNMFGNGSPSKAAYEYVSKTSRYNIRNKMDIASGELSGDIFELPAGPVSFAVGGEWRKQSLLQRSNTDPSVPLNVPYLRAVPPGRNLLQYNSTNVGSAVGDVTVREGFGEIAVPVLKDSAVGSLDLNGAARYTDYSTSGGVTTWKVGATYSPIEDVRIRGTLSRDIRAPSLFELYAGATANRAGFTDLHIIDPITNQPGLPGNVIFYTRGNANLQPERATTLTAGIGWKPSFLSGFSASVDYFRIKLEGAIGGISTNQIVNECEASNGTGPTCAFIDRPLPFANRTPDNYPSSISTVPFNLARTNVEGVDYEISYRTKMPFGVFSDAASLSLRVIGNHLITYEAQSNTTAPFIQSNNSVLNTKDRANFIVNYDDGSFNLNAQARYIGPRKKSQDPSIFNVVNNIPARTYVDTTVTYKFDLRGVGMEAYLTVNNLFNQVAPIFSPGCQPTQCYPTQAEIYDVVGRYYSAGLRFKF